MRAFVVVALATLVAWPTAAQDAGVTETPTEMRARRVRDAAPDSESASSPTSAMAAPSPTTTMAAPSPTTTMAAPSPTTTMAASSATTPTMAAPSAMLPPSESAPAAPSESAPAAPSESAPAAPAPTTTSESPPSPAAAPAPIAAPPSTERPPVALTLPDAPPPAPVPPAPTPAPTTPAPTTAAPAPAPTTAPAPAPSTATPAPSAPAPAPSAAPAPSTAPAFVIQGERADLGDEVRAIFDALNGDDPVASLFSLLVGLALAIVLALTFRRLRDGFPERGILPAVLAFLHLTVRLLVVAIGLMLVLRALPPRLSIVAFFTFVAVAVAFGWSVRDFLPDLVAGFVLVFERRVRRGTWVSAPGFAGQVERLGFRSTLLRDTQGRRIDVPNRHLLTAPVTSGRHHEREHEVEVHLESKLPAAVVRAALRDAVLASPWVLPGADAVVLRDPGEPSRWRVRGRLLENSFGARFEGELLERAEALLATVASSSLPEATNRRADPQEPTTRTRRAPDEPEPEA